MARQLRTQLHVRRGYLSLVFLAYANARIFHFQVERAERRLLLLDEMRPYFDVALLRELDCVPDEVEDNLAQTERVEEQQRHRLDASAQFDVVLARSHFEGRRDFVYQPPAVGRLGRNRHLAGLQRREVEYVVYQPQERLAADEYGVHRLAVLFVGLEAQFHHLRIADDGVEWGAYVVADGGEEVFLGLCGLAFAPRHSRIYGEHYAERGDDERHLYEVVARQRPVYQRTLAGEERFVGVAGTFRHRRQFRAEMLADAHNHGRREAVGNLADPHVRGEEYEEQQREPHDRRFAQAVLAVAAEYAPEAYEAQDAPARQHEVRLLGEDVDRPEVRHEKVEDEGEGDGRADYAAGGAEMVPGVAGDAEGAVGDVGVGYAGADGRDVHNPSDCGASEERHQGRYSEEEHDCIARAAVGVDGAEPARQKPVAGEREHEAARGEEMGDNAGHDGGERREPENGDAGASERLSSGEKDRHALDAFSFA